MNSRMTASQARHHMSKPKLCVPFQYNNESTNLVQRVQKHIQIAERDQVLRTYLLKVASTILVYKSSSRK